MRKIIAKSSQNCVRLRRAGAGKFCFYIFCLALLALPTAASANNLTLIKTTIGGVGTFVFTVSAPAVPAVTSLTTTAEGTPVSSVIPIDLGDPAATLTIVEAMPGPGWSLIGVTCTGLTLVSFSPGGTAVVDKARGASGTCTFTNKLDKPTTPDTHTFIDKRIDLLASEEPDRARLQRRFDRVQQLPPSLKDPAMKLGSAEAGAGRLSFSTSMSQISQANAAAAAGKLTQGRPEGQMNLGGTDGVVVRRTSCKTPASMSGPRGISKGGKSTRLVATTRATSASSTWARTIS